MAPGDQPSPSAGRITRKRWIASGATPVSGATPAVPADPLPAPTLDPVPVAPHTSRAPVVLLAAIALPVLALLGWPRPPATTAPVAQAPDVVHRPRLMAEAGALRLEWNPPLPATVPPEVIAHYEKQSRMGDPVAFIFLGYLAEIGQGVPRDPRRAGECYQKAAARGNPIAQAILGWCHETGAAGIPRDDDSARRLYRHAANSGEPAARTHLGELLLHEGLGDMGLELLQQAAQEGHPEAMFLLANQYQPGAYLPTDEAAALRWYQKAAALGHAAARQRLRELPGAATRP